MESTNNNRDFDHEPEEGATDLGEQMIEAMNEQTAAMDNLAQSIDEFAKGAEKLTKAIDKKLNLGSLIGGVFPGKKKPD